MPSSSGKLTSDEIKSLLKDTAESGTWDVTLPCAECIKRSAMADIAYDEKRQLLELKCADARCPFRMDVPFDWKRLSASQTINYLNENINCPDESTTRAWVMGLKYTHPTYFISQQFERDAAEDEVRNHILQALAEMNLTASEAKFMLIGANNCYELRSLPDGWQPENIHALDPAANALAAARAEFPGINTYVGLIEQREPFVNHHGKPFPMNEIDICLAFRSIQSSNLSLWGTLGKVRDKILKKKGKFMISIPKHTINYLGNRQIGIFKSGKLNAEYPKALTEEIAREMSEITGSEYFTDIKVIYGRSDSVEYYILGEAT